MNTFSKEAAIRFGWNTFKSNPWFYIGVTAFIAAASFVLQGLIKGERGPLSSLLGLAFAIVQMWLFVGFMRIALSAQAGTPVHFKMLFGEKWDVLWKYVVASIVGGIIAAIGFVLLIVPGVIAKVALSLAALLVLEKRMGPILALKESYRLTKGHKWNLFLFFVILILLNALGAIALGVGLLVTVPISLLAYVYVYHAIEKGVSLEPVKATPMPGAAPNTTPIV